MEDMKPIPLTPSRPAPVPGVVHGQGVQSSNVYFDRHELDLIMTLYGRHVANGDWRDYAVDFLKDGAVFSIFRRSSEIPIYRIEKRPKLSRCQGAYSVITTTGLILRRGHSLEQVLNVLEKKILRLVD